MSNDTNHPELRPCPWCRSTDVRRRLADVSELCGASYVGCSGCGARGPWHMDGLEAERLWNERADDFNIQAITTAPDCVTADSPAPAAILTAHVCPACGHDMAYHAKGGCSRCDCPGTAHSGSRFADATAHEPLPAIIADAPWRDHRPDIAETITLLPQEDVKRIADMGLDPATIGIGGGYIPDTIGPFTGEVAQSG